MIVLTNFNFKIFIVLLTLSGASHADKSKETFNLTASKGLVSVLKGIRLLLIRTSHVPHSQQYTF